MTGSARCMAAKGDFSCSSRTLNLRFQQGLRPCTPHCAPEPVLICSACCMLFAVRCLLGTVSFVLRPVCYVQQAASCVLSPVCCLLSPVHSDRRSVCCMLFLCGAVCCMLCAVCCMLCAPNSVLLAMCCGWELFAVCFVH
jgi:hypothetical protein